MGLRWLGPNDSDEREQQSPPCSHKQKTLAFRLLPWSSAVLMLGGQTQGERAETRKRSESP
jgi:hypothetical protein